MRVIIINSGSEPLTGYNNSGTKPLCQVEITMKLSKSEKVYLENYDIHDFDIPLASVDLSIFTIENGELLVLLVKRAEHPYHGMWSLPGGFVDTQTDKDLEATAYRKLEQKTGIKTPYVEQIETIGNKTRDRRGWSMTVLYFALIPHIDTKKQTEVVDEAQWMSLKKATKLNLAFDHKELLNKAYERLRSKVSYSTLPMHILPREFTLADLQTAYEVILDRNVDKKAFRRRIDAADLLVETGKSRQDGGRPAKLYRIKKGGKTYFYNRSI